MGIQVPFGNLNDVPVPFLVHTKNKGGQVGMPIKFNSDSVFISDEKRLTSLIHDYE